MYNVVNPYEAYNKTNNLTDDEANSVSFQAQRDWAAGFSYGATTKPSAITNVSPVSNAVLEGKMKAYALLDEQARNVAAIQEALAKVSSSINNVTVGELLMNCQRAISMKAAQK